MNKLLIIDPQNDFCDIDSSPHGAAALPVPGAMADLTRLAGLIDQCTRHIREITVTFDSHGSIAIERPGFWLTGAGHAVPPFTIITHAEVASGQFRPRQPQLLAHALHYLQALENGGRYQLMVWPVHCVLGTWGHAMPAVLSNALYDWELQTQTPVTKVLKGINPLTEQYSAIRAEVPLDDSTDTDQDLIDRVLPQSGGYLLVAGEASSHCVRATVEDLIPTMAPEQLLHTILLMDCMSPVPGFETHAAGFFDHCRSLGIQTLTTSEAAALLTV